MSVGGEIMGHSQKGCCFFFPALPVIIISIIPTPRGMHDNQAGSGNSSLGIYLADLFNGARKGI